VESESTAYLEDASLDVRTKIRDFLELTSLLASVPPEPSFQISRIVEVEGDTRRGKKPFPHPFPARMPIEVAQSAVATLSRLGDVVLDPMVGSGVVAKAALSLGRKAIGFDTDPLAIVQSIALCTSVSTCFKSTATRILKTAEKTLRSKKAIDAKWRGLDDEGRRFVRYWFRRKHANELFALSLAIENETNASEWAVFAALFSSLIISRGSGASRAMDLSRSRPHRVESKIPKSPFSCWTKQAAAFQAYYDNNPLNGRADLEVGDARVLEIEDDSIDAIITSPPYLNAIDYMRTSKFSLIFFGALLSKLREIRALSIGTEIGLTSGHLPKTLDRMVDQRVSDPKRRPMIRRYLFDLQTSLSESFRVLKPGGRALYVMGPSILSRRDYDAANVLGNIASLVGFRLLGHGRRDISELRRSLPPPRRSARAEGINKRMTCEFYVVLGKELG
jgi:DNA modification methylase